MRLKEPWRRWRFQDMWRGRRRWTWRGFKGEEGRKCKP